MVKNFHFSISFRPVLWSTKPPISWVPGSLSYRLSGRAMKLTTHLQLVPRSRKRGSIVHPLPHTSSWRSVELVKHRDKFTLLYLYIFFLYMDACVCERALFSRNYLNIKR
jgi:hypothetical protein